MNANSKNNVEKQSSSYTIRSTERVILSNGTVRYKWKSGDTPPKTLWFNYDSSAMSVTAMHDYSDSVVKEPTCTEQGYTTYCCNCGEMYVGNYVPAKGHTPMAVDSGTEATCTEPGYTAFIMCEVCFQRYMIHQQEFRQKDMSINTVNVLAVEKPTLIIYRQLQQTLMMCLKTLAAMMLFSGPSNMRLLKE